MKRNLRELCVAAIAVAVVAFMLAAPRFGIAQYAGQGNWGGTSSGSASAQIISLPNVTTMSNLRGVTISFIVGSGLTNPGPATLEVNTLGNVNVYRRNGGALIQLGGGEMPAGDMVRVTYDGTQWDLETDFTGGDLVGSTKIATYASADPGYLLEYGQCVAETSYPALYAKIGTTYSTQDSCSSGNFGIPDLRGALPAGLDNMGGTAANRITSAVSGVSGTTLGAAGGSQGIVGGITKAELASFDFTFPQTTITSNTGQFYYVNTGSSGSGVFYTNVNGVGDNADVYVPATSVPTGGSGDTVPTLPYVQIVTYEIKL